MKINLITECTAHTRQVVGVFRCPNCKRNQGKDAPLYWHHKHVYRSEAVCSRCAEALRGTIDFISSDPIVYDAQVLLKRIEEKKTILRFRALKQWKVTCKRHKVTPIALGTSETGALLFTLAESPTARYAFYMPVQS